MVYPDDQNPKNLVLFYLLPSSPRQPAGEVQSFRSEGWYSEGGQIKTNFSLFFSCVCVPVYAKYFWPLETISPVVVVVVFFKVWVSRFFVDAI